MKALLFILIIFFFTAFIIAHKLTSRNTTSKAPDQEQHASASEITSRAREDEVASEQVPFNWSRLESTNYEEYVSNLRTIACPEQTIVDILRGEISAQLAARFSQTNKLSDYGNPQIQMRQMLKKEGDSILYNQLKLQRPIRSAGVLFTSEEEERMAEAKLRFPMRDTLSTAAISIVKSDSNRVARLEFLSNYLSSEKIRYYKLDREGDAPKVQWILRGLQPTKEEFFAVADVIEGKDTSMHNGYYQPEVTAALQSVLSPDRFAYLQDMLQPEYQAILMFGRINRLSQNTISALVQLRRNWLNQDAETYQQQVGLLLKQPQTTARYLNDKGIHSILNR